MDAEAKWALDFANANLALLNVDVGDVVQQTILQSVAEGTVSADAAVTRTAARFGARIAPPANFVIAHYDDYEIPGSMTLRNRLIDDDHPLGIEDPTQFRQLELEISRVRLVELAMHPVQGELDYDHLKRIHGRIFHDIYSWAGTERVGPETPMIRYAPDTVNYGPGDPAAALVKYSYYPGPDIAEAASIQFAQLHDLARRESMPRTERLDRISESGGEIQSIHPFRDGNSRAMTAFSVQYQNSIGFRIDPADFLMGTPLRDVMVHAWYNYQATGRHTTLTRTLEAALAAAESERSVRSQPWRGPEARGVAPDSGVAEAPADAPPE
ncbi:Fic/DOC family protein [Subtercola sp. YIM 133946]|uniref:Fic/DOC family protein n=1 Tax=Subtercola sp. YIM 133946 TaxID=3118909 RepID=UPI002F928EC9